MTLIQLPAWMNVRTWHSSKLKAGRLRQGKNCQRQIKSIKIFDRPNIWQRFPVFPRNGIASHRATTGLSLVAAQSGERRGGGCGNQ